MSEFDFVENKENNASEFEKSLETISAADIAPKKEKKGIRGGTVAFNIFRYGLLTAFISVFVYCSYNIVAEMIAYSRANDLYSDLAERFESDDFVTLDGDSMPLSKGKEPSRLPSFDEDSSDETEGPDVNSEGALARAKIEELKKINPEAVGWIIIDGTNISLPVAQADNNETYLDIAFDGTQNWTGSIFMDYRNSSVTSKNKNTSLYGHNMEGGQLFSDVTKFLDEKFFYEHRYANLYTVEGIEVYEIFAIYKANETSNCADVDFESGIDFVDFCYEMQSNSIFYYDGVDFDEDDRLLTMVTCTNGDSKERYVLQGKFVRLDS